MACSLVVSQSLQIGKLVDVQTMPIQQSFSWWCFANRGVEAVPLLKAAKEIGYEAVELLPTELIPVAFDEGLVIASHQRHDSICKGLNDPVEHDRIEAELNRNLDLAVRYRIPNLIVFSGDRRQELSEEQGIENSVIGLTRVIKAAEQAGVCLVMELLNSKVDHGGYQCDRTSWGVEVCQGLNSPNFKLLYDIYHMQIMEGDVIRTIRDNHSYFGHYHTAGNPGRGDLDQSQELNYPAIIRAIANTGYSGFVGHEFIPKSDVIEALRIAYNLCNL